MLGTMHQPVPRKGEQQGRTDFLHVAFLNAFAATSLPCGARLMRRKGCVVRGCRTFAMTFDGVSSCTAWRSDADSLMDPRRARLSPSIDRFSTRARTSRMWTISSTE